MTVLYAQVIGVVVLLIAVVGLLAGEGPLLGFNIELVEDLIHVVSGGLLAYVGFAARRQARAVVGAVGVVYVLVGVVGFVAPMLFGLLPEYGYGVADNVLHLILGVLALVAVQSRPTTRAPA